MSLLSLPLHVHVLRALEEEPLALIDLRRAVGSPPQTTMRGHLRSLTEAGILERRRESDFPGSVDYELANYYTSTHPNSRFVQTLTAQENLEQQIQKPR